MTSDLTAAIERIERTVCGLQTEVASMRDDLTRIESGIKGSYGSRGLMDQLTAIERLEDINNARILSLEEWRLKWRTLATAAVAIGTVIGSGGMALLFGLLPQ